MSNLPLIHSINFDIIQLVIIVAIFIAVWSWHSLGGVASLVLIATSFIVDRGAPFINSWLARNQTGTLSSLQIVSLLHLAIITALAVLVLIVLHRLGRSVPMLIRVASAVVFAGLFSWYIAQELLASDLALQLNDTRVYDTLHQLYPVGLLLALVLAALELWFVRKGHGGEKRSLKKSKH